jgi:hypothetical protein
VARMIVCQPACLIGLCSHVRCLQSMCNTLSCAELVCRHCIALTHVNVSSLPQDAVPLSEILGVSDTSAVLNILSGKSMFMTDTEDTEDTEGMTRTLQGLVFFKVRTFAHSTSGYRGSTWNRTEIVCCLFCLSCLGLESL